MFLYVIYIILLPNSQKYPPKWIDEPLQNNLDLKQPTYIFTSYIISSFKYLLHDYNNSFPHITITYVNAFYMPSFPMHNHTWLPIPFAQNKIPCINIQGNDMAEKMTKLGYPQSHLQPNNNFIHIYHPKVLILLTKWQVSSKPCPIYIHIFFSLTFTTSSIRSPHKKPHSTNVFKT